MADRTEEAPRVFGVPMVKHAGVWRSRYGCLAVRLLPRWLHGVAWRVGGSRASTEPDVPRAIAAIESELTRIARAINAAMQGEKT
jgi:hypothetical protein